MQEIILIKYGEMALKGMNKRSFEDVLVKNIRRRIKSLGKTEITRAQSTIYIKPADECFDVNEAMDRLKKVFGIAALCRAAVCEKDFEDISKVACEYIDETLTYAKTFKVNAKRSDKAFPMKSPEICREVGGYLYENFDNLSVDVNNPDKIVMVEVREQNAFVYCGREKGRGGMPVGTNSRAALLLSGGIDSPVAGYMVAKRGVLLESIHFFSHPYTSQRAKEKVLELAGLLSVYTGGMKVHIVPFTDIQLEIKKKCPEEYLTIIMRRFMMRIAEKIARKNKLSALVTGESIGQVASQTVEALGVTNDAVSMPVFRPVIGMDKEEIVTIARDIGTFDTSILPYEDCCTVFTPKHPQTKPKLEKVKEYEKVLDIETLVDEAVAGVEIMML